jgi:hypothetical protein
LRKSLKFEDSDDSAVPLVSAAVDPAEPAADPADALEALVGLVAADTALFRAAADKAASWLTLRVSFTE